MPNKFSFTFTRARCDEIEPESALTLRVNITFWLRKSPISRSHLRAAYLRMRLRIFQIERDLPP
jgi:hypothetical protein